MSHGPVVARTCICRDVGLLELLMLVMVFLKIGSEDAREANEILVQTGNRRSGVRNQATVGWPPTQLFNGLHLGVSHFRVSPTAKTYSKQVSMKDCVDDERHLHQEQFCMFCFCRLALLFTVTS